MPITSDQDLLKLYHNARNKHNWYYYSVSDVQAADRWLFISVVGLGDLDADLSWDLENAVWAGLVLLHQDDDGSWTGAVENTAEFSQMLAVVPTTILSPAAKQAIGASSLHVPQATISAYRFPWQSGTSMQYGPRGVHTAGFFSGWKAVDFLSDGNTGAGHAPNRLLAAASGSVSYVCRDGTSVAIRIGDLLCAHLLDNGNLTIGHYFNQGDEIGQLRSGSFNANCGWADQGSNWFHVHWGFPDTGSFEAGGWTLNLSDELWRRGSETRGIYSWFVAEEGSTCSAPSLIEPADGATLSSRTITFRWDPVSGCTFNGYTFRVCTSPDVDNLSNCFIDQGEGGTQRTETINGHDNQDLYWGVRAANAPGGANWAVRRFRIQPGSASGNWNARYDQGSTCWWDTNCNMNPRCTETINGPELHRDWGSGAPCGGMNGDDWVGDFNATINFPTGDYVFYLDHDDGVKLWLNGQNIQDRGGSGSGPVCPPRHLSGDNQLRVLLREEGGDARVHLTWSTDTTICIPASPTPQSPANGSTFNEGQSITLCWSDTGDEYYGEIWGGPGGTLTFGWQSGTCVNIGSQWAGYTYSWHVRARNSAGTSGWSNTWTFTVRPAAPSNLSAQAVSCSQINLGWNDNSGNEEGYRIYRNGSYVGQVGANGTSYQDTGLTQNTSYSYYVRAFRGSIESNSSNTVNITTPFCPAPDPPVLVSPPNGATLLSNADITLEWNASSGASDYRVKLWEDNNAWSASHSSSTTDWHIGILPPGTYLWYVTARNQYGESNSDTWRFTVAEPVTVGPLLYTSHTVDDDNNDQSRGNGNGVIECGENIEMYIALRNHGNSTAIGVNATINTGDPYIVWLDSTSSGFPDIPGGGTGINWYDFDFAVDPNTPDGHVIQFHLDISASNGGPWSDSFSVPVTCRKPDLTPSQWGGWPYPIVPSSVPGTSVVNTLYAGQPTYIDWGISNLGNGDTGGNTFGDLYVDGNRVAHYDFGDVQAGWTWAFFDWVEVIDTPGWHTLRFVADVDNLINESDETNNAWEHQFYWIPSAPYSDDMESGASDWTATGLWHQVSAGNPYLESHSGWYSWWYGQDSTGNYDTGATNSGDLTSPSIYIPSTGYYLRFWYWYETEAQGRDWDQRWVQISVDNGPFNNVLQLSDDPMNWWLQSPAIDLSGYAGHVIRVRFHFNTIDDQFNNYRGWYIDDFSISTTLPPSCADAHEPNDTPAQATAISYGQTLSADICPGGDYDFYTFTGTAGDRVVIDVDAKTDGSLLDSYVFLLDSDSTTVLAEHDDEILYEVQDSHLGYHLPHDGTYYIKVKAWNHPSVGGTDYFYTIRLLTDHTSPSAEITSPDHYDWLDPNLQTITTDVSDNESGIRNVTFYWHDAVWDGSSDWVVLEDDHDPRDGWTYDLDTSGIPEQSQGCVVFIYAYDWAGHYAGYGSYSLGLDRTPPTVGAEVQQMYGDAPFRDFWVTWWNGWDNLSGIASYDVQYRDELNGAWINLLTDTTDTYYRFVGQNGHTYYFRARARDRAGNQSTYAGGNGDAQHTVQICNISPDAYEADNDAASARLVWPDALPQTHNFHIEGDQDWVRFYAAAGITYTLATTSTSTHADTMIYLYSGDGTTLIDYNDDYPGIWPLSRLDWRPSTGGFYLVKVRHWDPWAYGCTTEYRLSITGNEPTPFYQNYLPLVVRSQ